MRKVHPFSVPGGSILQIPAGDTVEFPGLRRLWYVSVVGGVVRVGAAAARVLLGAALWFYNEFDAVLASWRGPGSQRTPLPRHFFT